MKYYGQNQEDRFILDYFKHVPFGRFVDIGAYDVERFSNTRALYEKGWKGIFVEPSHKNYKSIADHYKDDKQIDVFNMAVGEFNGLLDFYSTDDAVSTSDELHMKKWANAGVKYTPIKVNQMRTVDFMDKYCRDANFISIDTEATNIQVFRDIPAYIWDNLQLLCIEHDGHIDEIENKLIKYGFFTLHTNAENIILGK